MLSQRSRGQKLEDVGVARKRSKRMKVNTGCTLATSSLHDGALSDADFDQSEWKIMYPRFVEEVFVGPSDCVNKKNI
jgi:hypothetical protein